MAFARRSLRSFQVLLLQRGNAAFAAWTAWSRPSFWVSVTLASSSPVTGSEIFIVLEESILWPFTIFGNPAVRRAFVSACSRLGWGSRFRDGTCLCVEAWRDVATCAEEVRDCICITPQSALQSVLANILVGDSSLST